MRRRVLLATAVAIAIGTGTASMQQLPPGYVDPAPVIAAAAKAIGTDNLKCVTVTGTRGYTGAVGQQRFADVDGNARPRRNDA